MPIPLENLVHGLKLYNVILYIYSIYYKRGAIVIRSSGYRAKSVYKEHGDGSSQWFFEIYPRALGYHRWPMVSLGKGSTNGGLSTSIVVCPNVGDAPTAILMGGLMIHPWIFGVSSLRQAQYGWVKAAQDLKLDQLRSNTCVDLCCLSYIFCNLVVQPYPLILWHSTG